MENYNYKVKVQVNHGGQMTEWQCASKSMRGGFGKAVGQWFKRVAQAAMCTVWVAQRGSMSGGYYRSVDGTVTMTVE